jgi:hypothetical protein
VDGGDQSMSGVMVFGRSDNTYFTWLERKVNIQKTDKKPVVTIKDQGPSIELPA